MVKIGKCVREVGGKEKIVGYLFWCPGCEEPHQFNVEGGLMWTFNHDLEKPTLSPSYLTWHDEGPKRKKYRCHSYIKEGKIKFLGDCTHKLKGQTVELPAWDKGDW